LCSRCGSVQWAADWVLARRFFSHGCAAGLLGGLAAGTILWIEATRHRPGYHTGLPRARAHWGWLSGALPGDLTHRRASYRRSRLLRLKLPCPGGTKRSSQNSTKPDQGPVPLVCVWQVAVGCCRTRPLRIRRPFGILGKGREEKPRGPLFAHRRRSMGKGSDDTINFVVTYKDYAIFREAKIKAGEISEIAAAYDGSSERRSSCAAPLECLQSPCANSRDHARPDRALGWLIAMLGLLALVIATSRIPCVPYGLWPTLQMHCR
jgi:hypothetical protein